MIKNYLLLSQSRKALGTFTKVKRTLTNINKGLEQSIKSSEEKIKKLQEEKNTLASTIVQHSKVITNIDKFLGDE